MGDDSITGLIERLSSDAAGAAWSGFLDEYTPLLRHVVRRQEHDPASAEECFNYVCEALSDDAFRRLRSFRPDGPARFRTWLTAVAANLCSDWRRRQRGRIRPVHAVARLPELDQQVYRLVFVQGNSRAACLAALAPRFPGLTDATVAEISARLFGLLTPQQRWQLSARPHRPVRCGNGDDDPLRSVEAGDPGPEEQAAATQEQRQLRAALAQLTPGQRLLLRLRYEQGLTLAEVARLTGQHDPFRANRQIHAALEALTRLMTASAPGENRKSD